MHGTAGGGARRLGDVRGGPPLGLALLEHEPYGCNLFTEQVVVDATGGRSQLGIAQRFRIAGERGRREVG